MTSLSTRLAGYEFEPAAFEGQPRTILFGNQFIDPNCVEGNVRAVLIMRLDCEIPQITRNGKRYFVLVPPGADHDDGKETKNDQAYKSNAENLGLNGLKWVHLKNPDIDYW